MLHCFTGTREELKTYLEMGLHIGVPEGLLARLNGLEGVGMRKWLQIKRRTF